MILSGIIGAQFITTIDPKSSQTVLGLIVLLNASSQLFSVRIPAPTARSEKWVTAIFGGFSGMLGGFAVYFGTLIIMYLLARKVTKEVFISCAAMLYLIGIVLVFLMLAYKGVLSEKELVL